MPKTPRRGTAPSSPAVAPIASTSRSPARAEASPSAPEAGPSGTRPDDDAPVPNGDASAPAPAVTDAPAPPADAPAPPADSGPTEAQLEAFAAFADEYHDIVHELPLELERNLKLLHELEAQAMTAQTDLKRDFLAWLAHTRPRAEARQALAPTPSSRKKKRKAPTPELPTPPSNAGSDAELAAQLAPTAVSTPLSAPREADLRKRIVDGSRAAVRMNTDKVALAVTVYDWVDRHIRRLDSDLAKYEDSLIIGLRAGTLPSSEVPSHAREAAGHGGLALGVNGDDDDELALSPRTRLTRSGLAGNIAADKVKSASDDKRKGKRKRSDDDDEDFIAGDMPVDPNEPVYCYCKKVSYGEMIACENEDCPTEWFHLGCAGLDRPPKGKWYCTHCIQELGIQPAREREPADRKPRKKRR